MTDRVACLFYRPVDFSGVWRFFLLEKMHDSSMYKRNENQRFVGWNIRCGSFKTKSRAETQRWYELVCLFSG